MDWSWGFLDAGRSGEVIEGAVHRRKEETIRRLCRFQCDVLAGSSDISILMQLVILFTLPVISFALNGKVELNWNRN